MEGILNRYFLRLSFNGETFHGWQCQQNGNSIQGTVREALNVILRTPVEIIGAGRTDAGVHAQEFFAHFDSQKEYSSIERKTLVNHLNGYLPDSISIKEILPVKEDAHARFSARFRTYQYSITRKKDPFRKDFFWFYPGKLNVELMNNGAAVLKETHDFASFAKLPQETKTTICHIEYINWEDRDDLLVFTITADRFLRNMVRAIVGTLIDLGRGKITLEDLEIIIGSKDRREAGFSVPAHGLSLISIVYPEAIFK